MVLKKKSFGEMVRDSLKYLTANSEITYLTQGSLARAFVEATTLEISRLQDFVGSVFSNSFLSTATGVYLDLFGEMLGVPRLLDRKATAEVEDAAVRFYVDSGTLGTRLLNPSDASTGLIPAGTTVGTETGSVQFRTTRDVTFPRNAKSVFVPVASLDTGSASNVGANLLTVHDLTSEDVRVTNDVSITTGTDTESDPEYRYRLSKAMTSKFGGNATAINVTALSQPGVARVQLLPYARGAGTFDVLLVPQGNRLTNTTLEDTRRAIEAVAAYGVSPKVREPNYVRFRIIVQLTYVDGTADGQKLAARSVAESAILNYLGTLPLGGELIINQIRATILSSSPSIKDLKIVEICVDGAPRVIRNIQLEPDELIIPDELAEDAIQVL